MNTGLKVRRSRAPRLNFGQAAALDALKNQGFQLSFPYWSTVRFNFVRSGAGPYTYTMTVSEVTAFSYAIGDVSPSTAGYSGTGLAMDYSETNLLTKHETLGGEQLRISGIGIQPCAGQDAALTALVWRNTAALLSFNGGSQRLPLGPLSLLPGGGGLTGAGPDTLGTQAIPGGRPIYSHQSNGFPNRHNLMRLPEGITWRNKSQRDGQFAIILKPASGRTITVTTPTDEAAAAGIRGYTYPTAASVDVLIWLDGTVTGKRSRVV